MTPIEVEAAIINHMKAYEDDIAFEAFSDKEMLELADVVLIPTKNSILVRGRGKFRKWINTEFTGRGRIAETAAYLRGLQIMHAKMVNLVSLFDDMPHMLWVTVRLD